MNFPIGDRVSEIISLPVIKAFGDLKKADAEINVEYGLDLVVAEAISQAVIRSSPAPCTMTTSLSSSGTQSNMNTYQLKTRAAKLQFILTTM